MSRKQTIYRAPKNRENPYVMVDKRFINLPEMSLRSKAVLLYILSKPDHWKVNVQDIMAHCRDGRDAVYAALKELIEHGYVQRVCHREHGKIRQYEYIVNEQLLQSESDTYTPSESPEEEQMEQQEPDHPQTDQPEEEEAEKMPLVSDDASSTPDPISPQPEVPHPVNPTQGSNDFSNKLLNNNKPCSSRACSTILDVWQEIFSSELSTREYDALLKVCSRTVLVRNLCLIQEHHCVPSIVAPFSFVMKCITGGGYKVPKKVPYEEKQYEKKKSKPLPKAVQRQRDGIPYVSPYSPEETERRKAALEEKIRKMYEEHPLPNEKVV